MHFSVKRAESIVNVCGRVTRRWGGVGGGGGGINTGATNRHTVLS